MTIKERLKAPTPKFFRVLRNVGLGLAAAGGVLVAAPVALPALAVTIGGYLIVAGSVATAVSQAVVDASTSPVTKETDWTKETSETKETEATKGSITATAISTSTVTVREK
ncbi:MAG: hypothetical protein K0R26_2929 [Bacteroidota bacterium]|jgi:hypothetical protein|nr:hypothetical protein [Bacteroidota bacterium]